MRIFSERGLESELTDYIAKKKSLRNKFWNPLSVKIEYSLGVDERTSGLHPLSATAGSLHEPPRLTHLASASCRGVLTQARSQEKSPRLYLGLFSWCG